MGPGDAQVQDLHMRQVAAGRTYEQIAPKLQKAMTRAEYHVRAKQFYIAKEAAWSEVPMLETVCSEQEYYTELVSVLKAQERLYPYHIAKYICRVQRVTAFRYYTDILVAALKAERAYDSIPNFTAADIVRVIGVGRNEFIDILNRCRGKFMWKLNKAAARDLLPAEPRSIELRSWWTVEAVAVTNDEMRRSRKKEIEMVDKLLTSGAALEVGELNDLETLISLYKRGLVYVDVPIAPDDRISIPPLENFVSNKSNRDDDISIEGVLYSVFVASSERASVGELANILEVDLERVLRAVSLGCRLGFAEKIIHTSRQNLRRAATQPSSRRTSLGLDGGSGGADGSSVSLADSAMSGNDDTCVSDRNYDGDVGSVHDDDDDGAEDEQMSRRSFAAILVDTTLTSFLMMGNLSAGLKRHAVTLFEGGKLSDTNVMEFNNELRSVESSDSTFEGTVEEIVEHVQSLRVMLEGICSLRQDFDGSTGSEASISMSGELKSKQEAPPQPPPLPSSPPLPSQQQEQKAHTHNEGETEGDASSQSNLIDVADMKTVDTEVRAQDLMDHGLSSLVLDSVMTDSDAIATRESTTTPSPSESQGEFSPRVSSSPSPSVVTPIVVGGIDVVRVESMSTLPRDVCRRVLQRDYSLVIETTPLRAYPLPLLPPECSTTVIGMPGIELQLPWTKMAMHVFCGAGPKSLVIPAGTRLRELPHTLSDVPFVALWPWNCQNGPSQARVVATASLLATLNGCLNSHATMVQELPRWVIDESGRQPTLMTASIPLPMCTNEDGKIVAFTNNGSWDPIEIASPSSGAGGTREEECIARLVRVLALNNTVGVLEVACTGECEGVWLPHDLFLGIPLFHTKLCQIVMSRALAGGLFSVEGLARHKDTVAKIRAEVRNLIRTYALSRRTPLPSAEGGATNADGTWDERAESAQPREAILISRGTVSKYSLSAFVQGGLTLQDILWTSSQGGKEADEEESAKVDM